MGGNLLPAQPVNVAFMNWWREDAGKVLLREGRFRRLLSNSHLADAFRSPGPEVRNRIQMESAFLVVSGSIAGSAACAVRF